jgi:hypothetical protein
MVNDGARHPWLNGGQGRLRHHRHHRSLLVAQIRRGRIVMSMKTAIIAVIIIGAGWLLYREFA